MKKSYVFLLSIFIFVSTLSGCNNTGILSSKETTNPIKDYDNETMIAVTEKLDNGTDRNNTDASEKGFAVKDKKYNYEGNDVIILNIMNQADKSYNIGIIMTYYDENSNVLKKESKTFDGFAAGWQNYFIFQPEITFNEYKYDIMLEEFGGEIVCNKVIVDYNGLAEAKNIIWEVSTEYIKFPQIEARFLFYHTYAKSNLDSTVRVAVFDNKGELYKIFKSNFTRREATEPVHYSNMVYYNTENPSELVWPENLKGDTTAVFSIEYVKLSDME